MVGPDASAGAAAPASRTDVVQYDYEPLLRALGGQCRRILLAAHIEADRVRTEARDEAHRMVTEARREQTTILERATAKQASIYQEVNAEIDRRLRELREQRESILRRAEADAEDLRLAAARSLQQQPPTLDPATGRPLQDLQSVSPSKPSPSSGDQSDANREFEQLLAEVGGVDQGQNAHDPRHAPPTAPGPAPERRRGRRWRRDY